MAVETLYDPRARKPVMWCNTDGRAFGPVFDDHDAAEFLDWIGERDARSLTPSELVRERCRFVAQREHTGTTT